MGTRRYRKGGGHLPPKKCSKVVFVLQMLSKASVDEVLMHYLRKCCHFLGALPQTSTGELPLDPARDFLLSEPLIAHRGKNPVVAHDTFM